MEKPAESAKAFLEKAFEKERGAYKNSCNALMNEGLNLVANAGIEKALLRALWKRFKKSIVEAENYWGNFEVKEALCEMRLEIFEFFEESLISSR